MRRALFFAIGASVLRCTNVPASTAPELAPSTAPPGSSAPVVVELFTSEGCSSCPPADDLLAHLATEARRAGRPLAALAFHVDYWNDLGWPDPMSRPEFTERQRRYAEALGTRGIYTPQMIVEGRDAFVGSDRARAERSIADAARLAPAASVAIEGRASGGEATVSFSIAGAPEGATLAIALVEDGVVQPVPRGENAGRTLRHDAVVRSFHTEPASPRGEATLRFAPSARPTSIVAFVQDPSFAIVGAAVAPLAR